MSKGSLGLLVVLLALGIIVNVWQGGATNLITLLGYAPLAICIAIYGIAWFMAPKR